MSACCSPPCGPIPGSRASCPRGTPVAQCFPVARAALELAFEPFTEAERAAYGGTAARLLGTPGVYRKDYRARRPRSAGEHAAELPEIKP